MDNSAWLDPTTIFYSLVNRSQAHFDRNEYDNG